jgi:acyl-CoA thioester hydrolase
MDELPCNVIRVRLRMYHTDLSGVFHGRVFELFEEARTEVFRRLGSEYRQITERGVIMIVTHADASFLRPLRTVDEEIEARIFVSHRSGARLTIEYELRRIGDETPAITGHTAFAFIDVARERPVPVPKEITAAIERCPKMVRAPVSG